MNRAFGSGRGGPSSIPVAVVALVGLGAGLIVPGGGGGVLGGGVAHANPRPLPMTYPYETSIEGEMEIEQYVDLVPLPIHQVSGAAARYLALALQTEVEYGLTDRLELGLYFVLAPGPGEAYRDATSGLMFKNSLKQRLRYRLGEPQSWPVNVTLYGEVVEAQDEIEFEAKVILQRRIGRARLMANLSGERELYLNAPDEWVLNPSVGVTYELSPRHHLGVETWWWAEFPAHVPQPRPFSLEPQGYVGPAYLLSLRNFWWSTGAYARITNTDHVLLAGEPFGKIWFRTVVGVTW